MDYFWLFPAGIFFSFRIYFLTNTSRQTMASCVSGNAFEIPFLLVASTLCVIAREGNPLRRSIPSKSLAIWNLLSARRKFGINFRHRCWSMPEIQIVSPRSFHFYDTAQRRWRMRSVLKTECLFSGIACGLINPSRSPRQIHNAELRRAMKFNVPASRAQMCGIYWFYDETST